jgi:two-component system nitrogen regulation response regulator GlnG
VSHSLVRELRGSIRAMARSSNGPREELRFSLREIAGRAAAEAERQAIRLALRATRGNKSEAARLLRVDYKTLYLKIKQYRISAGQFRQS